MKHILPLVAATVSAALSCAASEPLTIAAGWDLLAVSPAMICEHADKFASLPYDGVTVRLIEDGAKEPAFSHPCDNVVWSLDEMERKFGADCRKLLKCKGLSRSFVLVPFAPRRALKWTSDADWARFGANMKTLATFVKACGFQGIVLDTEDYWKVCPFELKASDAMSYDAARKLARQRGAEVFRGVFEAFPDIKIVTYWWLSFRGAYGIAQTANAFARGVGDLLPAFTDGMLDVMPWTVRFYDGNEHTYHSSYVTSAIHQRVAHQALIVPENRAKFRACTGIAGAFYLDMYINPEFNADGTHAPFYMAPAGGRRLNRFLDRYEDAKYNAELVWIYGEKRAHVDWRTNGRCVRFSEAFTNGTWNAALPGMNEELRILRDPQGELVPRLRAAKAAGQALDLATELKTSDGGYNYSMEVTDTRYGEWYAVLVEMKSDHPSAGVRLKKGKWDIWTRATASVVFSEPDANGLRRGIAFQRIWDDADTLLIHCGYNDYIRTKPGNLKVSVYRVFTPKN